MRVVADTEIRHLQVPERLLSYADAYRDAATVLCEGMAADTVLCTWPNAAVVLMLAAHAVELFLKGVILKRSPATEVWDHLHNIDDLSARYESMFLEPSFSWDIPFKRGEFPSSLTDAEVQVLKCPTPPPSILYRYPVGKGGNEWRGIHGFEPHSFLKILSELKSDFQRIKAQLV